MTDGLSTYAWDAESQVKTAAGVGYTYDGDGNRVKKSNGKLYWYGAGSEVLDESDLVGNITDEYVFFGGKRVAHRNVSGGSVYYYAADSLGSSRVVTTSSGIVCYEADFQPFGGEYIVTNTCPQNYKFTGKERDTETGNDDFGARYFSPSLGRWLSPDWSAIPAPVPYASLTNPQTLNLYQYVGNNPETFADMDGHLWPIGVRDPPSVSMAAFGACGKASGTANCDAEVSDGGLAAEQKEQKQVQNLSEKSENAILNSSLTAEQAIAFESAVIATGNANGINPNILVGMAMKESTLDPTAVIKNGSASGLFGLTDSVKSAYGLSKADATGSTASAITNQVNAAAGYLHDLTKGQIPVAHPSQQLEIALGYYRGARKSVNKAMNSKGGYNAMLKLRFGGETLGKYIKYVESYQ